MIKYNVCLEKGSENSEQLFVYRGKDVHCVLYIVRNYQLILLIKTHSDAEFELHILCKYLSKFTS